MCGRPQGHGHFFLSNSKRRVKRFRVSGLSARRVDVCRWPAWRCVGRVRIAFARLEAPRKPDGFPDSVSMTVCPCIILGFSRIFGVVRLRLEFSSGSQTLEPPFFHFLIRSCGFDRRPPRCTPSKKADCAPPEKPAATRCPSPKNTSSLGGHFCMPIGGHYWMLIDTQPGIVGSAPRCPSDDRGRAASSSRSCRASASFPSSTGGGQGRARRGVPPTPEALHRRREGLDRHGADGADARNDHQALRFIALLRPLAHLPVQLPDLLAELLDPVKKNPAEVLERLFMRINRTEFQNPEE